MARPVLPAHVVFATRYRHQVVTAAHPERLEQIMRDACADSGTRLTKFTGEPSHVHLPVRFPPNAALSRAVNSLTGLSSRRLRQESPAPARHYWRANPLGSYFAGSAGGAPISVLPHYIEQQNRPA